MVGKVINGKYRITEKLGTGGSAEVYKAYHVHLKTPWALKVIQSTEDCAMNELKILKNINHPAFPRLVDVIAEGRETILVFDYYDGPTLQKVLDEFGPIEEERVRNMADQILDALMYLHSHKPEPIIYRDLKPSNLILLPGDSIRLIDFGTARLFKQNRVDDTVYLGTPGYAAPEQFGTAQTDIRTDIYNFGMTLFHLLTGKHPLHLSEQQCGQALSMAGVSSQLGQVLIKSVSKNPEDRYFNIAEIKTAINNPSMDQSHSLVPKAIGKNAVEISVSGTQSGVGVTHFCLLFGMWLKNRGFKTAVLEYSENRDTMALCKLVGKDTQFQRNGFFQIHGLSIFPAMGKEQIDNFKRAEYDYILIDYGVYDEYVSIMIRRSDVKLILVPGADWKLGHLGAFLKKYGEISKDDNTYLCFPLQNMKSMHIIQSYYRFSNMITVPYAINPWKMAQAEKHELGLIYDRLFQSGNRKNFIRKRREM